MYVRGRPFSSRPKSYRPRGSKYTFQTTGFRERRTGMGGGDTTALLFRLLDGDVVKLIRGPAAYMKILACDPDVVGGWAAKELLCFLIAPKPSQLPTATTTTSSR